MHNYMQVTLRQTLILTNHTVRDFVPLLFADPLQVIKVSRLTFGN